MLLAWYAHPQPKPRLRAHRLVRASGRAAAGAAQPAGTMAPFARNDKTILEIALPALVGFNASVSFGAARLVDASPTARRRAEPRTAAMGVQRTAGARAAAGARRKGGLACSRGGGAIRACHPRRPGAGPQRRATHSTQRGLLDAECGPAARRRETRSHRAAATRRQTPRSGVLALAFTTYTFFSLKGEPTGKDVGRPLVDKYGAMIKEGAMAFLKEEYKWLSVFVRISVSRRGESRHQLVSIARCRGWFLCRI